MDKISPSQLFAVFATETLDEDIANILNINNEFYMNQNSKNIYNDKKFLSKKSYNNLKSYLADDYLYLSKLIDMNKTSSVDKQLLLKWIFPISAIQISFLSFLKSSTTFKVSITLRDSLSNLETTSLDPDLSSDKTFWKIGLFLNSTPPETTSV